MTRGQTGRLAALLLLALAAGGCGLKGALTLPPKSDEVIIRGPGEAAPAPAGEPAEGEASVARQSRRPRRRRSRPRTSALPPPPLPGSNAAHPRWLTLAHWCWWTGPRTCTGPFTRCRR